MLRSLGDFTRNLPNGGLCSDEEKVILKEMILKDIDPDRQHMVFAVDYGYIGPVRYREGDIDKEVFFALISCKDVETYNSQILESTANALMIASTDFEPWGDITWIAVGNGPGHEKSLIDNVRYAICDAHMYRDYLKEIVNAIPDTDLHGILDI
jgi:hypothetical protein